MDIRYYWITDYLVHNELAFKYCPTEEMVADLFTKGVTTFSISIRGDSSYDRKSITYVDKFSPSYSV